MKNRFSLLAFWFSAVVIAAVVVASPRYLRQHTEATLAWDVSGYYLYLPAIFIYDDLDELKFLPDIIEKYRPSPTPDQAFPTENGHQVMKYPAGMAVLYAPFFFLGHLIAHLTDYPADGFSLPYQAAIQLGGVLVALLGLWFLRKTLLRFFSDGTTGWALLLLALGTNFFNYATFDVANVHAWLFTLVALLLHFTIRWHERPTLRDGLLIGVCLGLAALVRPTEIILALVPVFWGITGVKDLRPKMDFLMKNITHVLAAAVAVAAIGCIQLAYWKSVSGHWLVYSYQDQGFSFLRPHFADVFFSYRKGWLVYTPLMLFAVAGFYFLFKNRRKLFLPVFVFFIVNTWIICAWDIWWYGGAFGQRAMVQSYPLLALPFAAFLAWQADLPLLWKTLLSMLLAGCVALNLFQTYQAHWGPWEADMMNRAYYWRIFATVKNDPYDRLLLDAKEGFSGERETVATVLSADFESRPDSTGLTQRFARSGQFSTFVGPQNEYSHTLNISRSEAMQPGRWLHIGAWFYTPETQWDAWRMPQFTVRFEYQGQPVKDRVIRPGRVLRPGEWQPAGMDIRVLRKDFDRIRIFVWNAGGPYSLFVDDLEVEVFED